MLPSFGEGRVWYSRLTQLGMFITNDTEEERAIISGDGLNMSPTLCNGRVYFTSTRDGNSEIYSARRDGTSIRRLTQHPAIDVGGSWQTLCKRSSINKSVYNYRIRNSHLS